MCACEIYDQMTLSEKGKWQHFIHWNLNFCLLSHDLRNLHLLLFWKSFDLSLPRYIKSSKCKFPCVRLQTFFYEIQTYISLCLFAEYINRGRGSGLRFAVSTEPLPRKTHQHGNCYQRVYRYIFVFLNIKTSPKGLVPVFCYDQQKKQLRCT